ncbi:transposable element Tcb2 transposase [Trichonephila clavipes]|nr:transposable element Tcb2 transposase [Trichonephila clavipes]
MNSDNEYECVLMNCGSKAAGKASKLIRPLLSDRFRSPICDVPRSSGLAQVFFSSFVRSSKLRGALVLLLSVRLRHLIDGIQITASNFVSQFPRNSDSPELLWGEIKQEFNFADSPQPNRRSRDLLHAAKSYNMNTADFFHLETQSIWASIELENLSVPGRVRSTTPAEDRYIVLSAKRNRRTTAQQVANQFLAASGKQISRKTVARRLRGGRLYARRPVVCVPLTRQHRTAHLQWCREHHNWTEQDWACVLFSDESRFSLSSDCRRQLIWRESGTAYRPENIQEKDRYPTCSIMVWAGIMMNGRTPLHVVANGTMTGQRYIDEVLFPHVRLFRGAVGDKFVFMDDNATCHRTLAVQDCLDS